MRDSARVKGAVVDKEETTEVPIEYRQDDVLFLPAATFSCHRLITKDDITEYLSDKALAKLLEENFAIGITVLEAKEERARAIAALEAAERAERQRKEREEPLKDVEAKERAGAKAMMPRVTVMEEVGAMTCPDFLEEAYMPSTLHLFMLSGLAAYMPQRSEYDAKLVLRDPTSQTPELRGTELPEYGYTQM
ncbi:hypothetical protein RHMOL_Rhmol08G0155600 [Rhododendron molle]|uniref:Uncharacterized protein n=1 Tax=Rhododendron molle TaxID=49168 RepID=A0ACC0MNR9_RHOML|nr:hypothetical protein RHMOL_Rhmol08G0155600 [Rhododendron molle]